MSLILTDLNGEAQRKPIGRLILSQNIVRSNHVPTEVMDGGGKCSELYFDVVKTRWTKKTNPNNTLPDEVRG